MYWLVPSGWLVKASSALEPAGHRELQLVKAPLWRGTATEQRRATLPDLPHPLQGRHPLALGHFANHPPAGAQPNVMVASFDFQAPGAAGPEGLKMWVVRAPFLGHVACRLAAKKDAVGGC